MLTATQDSPMVFNLTQFQLCIITLITGKSHKVSSVSNIILKFLSIFKIFLLIAHEKNRQKNRGFYTPMASRQVREELLPPTGGAF